MFSWLQDHLIGSAQPCPCSPGLPVRRPACSSRLIGEPAGLADPVSGEWVVDRQFLRQRAEGLAGDQPLAPTASPVASITVSAWWAKWRPWVGPWNPVARSQPLIGQRCCSGPASCLAGESPGIGPCEAFWRVWLAARLG